MSDEQQREVSLDELEDANGEPLPDREAMSVVPFPGEPIGGITLPIEPPEAE